MVRPGGADPTNIDGDYNQDGTVDAADEYIVSAQYTRQLCSPLQRRYGDGDGTIDEDDYNVWRAHFGEVGPAPRPGSGAGLSSSSAEPKRVSCGVKCRRSVRESACGRIATCPRAEKSECAVCAATEPQPQRPIKQCHVAREAYHRCSPSSILMKP